LPSSALIAVVGLDWREDRDGASAVGENDFLAGPDGIDGSGEMLFGLVKS
jgi:hypothetical protein